LVSGVTAGEPAPKGKPPSTTAANKPDEPRAKIIPISPRTSHDGETVTCQTMERVAAAFFEGYIGFMG
jgi:hypothetical protein